MRPAVGVGECGDTCTRFLAAASRSGGAATIDIGRRSTSHGGSGVGGARGHARVRPRVASRTREGDSSSACGGVPAVAARRAAVCRRENTLSVGVAPTRQGATLSLRAHSPSEATLPGVGGEGEGHGFPRGRVYAPASIGPGEGGVPPHINGQNPQP